jgi:hypothetical protein
VRIKTVGVDRSSSSLLLRLLQPPLWHRLQIDALTDVTIVIII